MNTKTKNNYVLIVVLFIMFVSNALLAQESREIVKTYSCRVIKRWNDKASGFEDYYTEFKVSPDPEKGRCGNLILVVSKVLDRIHNIKVIFKDCEYEYVFNSDICYGSYSNETSFIVRREEIYIDASQCTRALRIKEKSENEFDVVKLVRSEGRDIYVEYFNFIPLTKEERRKLDEDAKSRELAEEREKALEEREKALEEKRMREEKIRWEQAIINEVRKNKELVKTKVFDGSELDKRPTLLGGKSLNDIVVNYLDEKATNNEIKSDINILGVISLKVDSMGKIRDMSIEGDEELKKMNFDVVKTWMFSSPTYNGIRANCDINTTINISLKYGISKLKYKDGSISPITGNILEDDFSKVKSSLGKPGIYEVSCLQEKNGKLYKILKVKKKTNFWRTSGKILIVLIIIGAIGILG